MKSRIISGIAAAVAACLVLTACAGDGKMASNAGGRPYEIVVSIGQEQWDGPVGDTLRSVLFEPVPMLNQREPKFDIARVAPASLKDVVLRHRNIMIIRINPGSGEPTSEARYNMYARPQLMLTLTAPTDSAMVAYLDENRAEILYLFETTERDRAVANNREYGEKGIDREIFKKFGFEMNIPRGFAIRSQGDDFMWIGNDNRTVIQGIAIYSYPYSGSDDFRPENLIKRRDEFMGRIPGPSEGSYMITGDYLEPEVTYPKINGRQWAEMHGLWQVANDFMGGPFVSFATLDRAGGRVVAIDCFVHSPKEHKRNPLHQLEHTVYSVEFPSAAAGE